MTTPIFIFFIIGIASITFAIVSFAYTFIKNRQKKGNWYMENIEIFVIGLTFMAGIIGYIVIPKIFSQRDEEKC